MKKFIYKDFLINLTARILYINLALSIIVWTIQAVNFLDFINNDGHGLKVYLFYTFLNLPKIFERLLPFVFFISLIIQLNQYEKKNELIVFWIHGINYEDFIKTILKFSIVFVLIHIFLSSVITPITQDLARSSIRSSNIDFFPNLIKEKKFADISNNLTIYSDEKIGNTFKNILIKERTSSNDTNSFKVITAKKGELKNNNNFRVFELNDGIIFEFKNKTITNFTFNQVIYNLQNVKTKSTTFRKIQETSTLDLVSCIGNFYFYKMDISIIGSLMCQDTVTSEILQELNKRFLKPVFTLYLSFMILLSITINNSNSKKKILYFLSAIIILIYSELFLRYSGINIFYFYFYSIIPFIFFTSIYVYKIIKLKKN
jgi:lipopolysaccharide export system permease protein